LSASSFFTLAAALLSSSDSLSDEEDDSFFSFWTFLLEPFFSLSDEDEEDEEEDEDDESCLLVLFLSLAALLAFLSLTSSSSEEDDDDESELAASFFRLRCFCCFNNAFIMLIVSSLLIFETLSFASGSTLTLTSSLLARTGLGDSDAFSRLILLADGLGGVGESSRRERFGEGLEEGLFSRRTRSSLSCLLGDGRLRRPSRRLGEGVDDADSRFLLSSDLRGLGDDSLSLPLSSSDGLRRRRPCEGLFPRGPPAFSPPSLRPLSYFVDTSRESLKPARRSALPSLDWRPRRRLRVPSGELLRSARPRLSPSSRRRSSPPPRRQPSRTLS